MLKRPLDNRSRLRYIFSWKREALEAKYIPTIIYILYIIYIIVFLFYYIKFFYRIQVKVQWVLLAGGSRYEKCSGDGGRSPHFRSLTDLNTILTQFNRFLIVQQHFFSIWVAQCKNLGNSSYFSSIASTFLNIHSKQANLFPKNPPLLYIKPDFEGINYIDLQQPSTLYHLKIRLYYILNRIFG